MARLMHGSMRLAPLWRSSWVTLARPCASCRRASAWARSRPACCGGCCSGCGRARCRCRRVQWPQRQHSRRVGHPARSHSTASARRSTTRPAAPGGNGQRHQLPLPWAPKPALDKKMQLQSQTAWLRSCGHSSRTSGRTSCARSRRRSAPRSSRASGFRRSSAGTSRACGWRLGMYTILVAMKDLTSAPGAVAKQWRALWTHS
mmetsp:Transcript_18805/g.53123  ORF Transcript_18805/g.53123 Transcript_18805/m.53123 type:complete len:203 (-) Transcript_18805:307-915(-)